MHACASLRRPSRLRNLLVSAEPKISIVIPCFNERATIRTLIDRVRAVELPSREIVVVDDGSTDGTRDILDKDIRPLVDQLIFHDRNQGKGAALRTGFAAATGDILLIQDADLEYDPKEYPVLLAPLLQHGAAVLAGLGHLHFAVGAVVVGVVHAALAVVAG